MSFTFLDALQLQQVCRKYFYFKSHCCDKLDGEYTAIDAPQGIFFNGLDNSQWQNLKNTYC